MLEDVHAAKRAHTAARYLATALAGLKLNVSIAAPAYWPMVANRCTAHAGGDSHTVLANLPTEPEAAGPLTTLVMPDSNGRGRRESACGRRGSQ